MSDIFGWGRRGPKKRPVPPPPPPFDEAAAQSTCERIWRDKLEREIDPGGLAGCLNQLRGGTPESVIEDQVEASDERKALLARKAKEAEDAERRRPSASARLRVQGRELFAGDRRFAWRFVTSFALAKFIADGREAEAVAALDAAAKRFNGVRVLVMAKHLFELAPADGVRALPRLFHLAGERGLYVETVALADTASYEFDMAAHVREVAEACDAAPNAVLEIANEPRHGTQRSDLHDYATLARLAEGLPADLLVTLGPSDDDEALEPAGDYVVRHLDRGRDPLNQIRRMSEVAKVARALNKFLVSDEPTGADELDGSVTGRQRIAAPYFHAAHAVLARGFGLGATHHNQAGLRSQPLGPNQEACADAAFVASTLLPDDLPPLVYFNAGHDGSPVLNPGGSEAFEDRGNSGGAPGPIVRAFSFVHPSEPWGIVVVLHRPEAYPEGVLSFGNGWSPREVIKAWPHVSVRRVER